MQDSYSYEYADQGILAGLGVGMILVYLVILLVVVISMWKIFDKAGKPGWAAIVPIYNYIVMLEIIGKPVWWVILLLIPCVNIVILIIMMLELAKSFGKSAGFGVGLIFLGIVFLPILGFGDARYVGPGGAGSNPVS